MPDRTSCRDGDRRAGAVHLRYDCADGALWVLVYVYGWVFLAGSSVLLAVWLMSTAALQSVLLW